VSYILVNSPNPTTPQGGYPRRGGYKPSGTCIVHTSEGAWNAGVDSLTRLVRTRADYGCYHRACDWQDIALYYPWEWEAWQDTETNPWAVGIAAACRTTDWAVMPADIRAGFYRNLGIMAADFVNYMKVEYGITVPLKRISGAQARAGVPGFCAHGDSGVSRTDPGPQFDWPLFFKCTQQALGSAALAPQSTTIPAKAPTGKAGFMADLTEGEQREALNILRELRPLARDQKQGIPGVQSDGDSFAVLRGIANKLGVKIDEAARKAKYGKKK
jgi:hypothetical protein